MHNDFAADNVRIKKYCNRLSSKKSTLKRKTATLHFGLSGNVGYDVYLIRFIGKLVVDFLLAIIELFTLGVTANALRAKSD